MRRRRSRPGRGRHTATPSEPGVDANLDPPLGEVELVISQTADWIRGADTKAGFTLTALVVLLSAIATDASGVRDLWTKRDDAPPSLWLLAVSIAAISVALVVAALVVLPRTPSPKANRFSWPWLASVPLEEVIDQLGSDVRAEAWHQAWTLAGIARDKHRLLQVAMSFGFLAAVSFISWKIFFA